MQQKDLAAFVQPLLEVGEHAPKQLCHWFVTAAEKKLSLCLLIRLVCGAVLRLGARLLRVGLGPSVRFAFLLLLLRLLLFQVPPLAILLQGGLPAEAPAKSDINVKSNHHQCQIVAIPWLDLVPVLFLQVLPHLLAESKRRLVAFLPCAENRPECFYPSSGEFHHLLVLFANPCKIDVNIILKQC